MLAVSFGFASLSFGATIIVDNNSNRPINVTSSLQVALDSAEAGDVIQVIPSATSYGSGTVKNPVTIVGVGHYVDTQDGLVSRVAQLTFQNSAGGSIVNGLKAGNFTLNSSFDGLEVKNSSFGNVSMYSGVKNILVHNCIMTGSIEEILTSQSNHSKITISNNIIVPVGGRAFRLDGNTSEVVISNNVFKGSSSKYLGYELNNCIVTNNVFVGGIRPDIQLSGTGNSFSNNVSFSSVAFPSGTNSSTNNLTSTDPLFVNEGGTSFDYGDDYHLQSGSPAENFGSDGNDAGLYGGMYPWPTITNVDAGFQNGTVPDLPRVTEMNVRNASVPETGQLEVDVVGEVQQ